MPAFRSLLIRKPCVVTLVLLLFAISPSPTLALTTAGPSVSLESAPANYNLSSNLSGAAPSGVKGAEIGNGLSALVPAWYLAGMGKGARTAKVQPAPQLQSGGVLTVCLATSGSCPYTNVQDAVDAASAGEIIKVAQGVYTGTGSSVVYITKSLVLQGGYTVTNWSTPNPDAHPTVMDGEVARRVVYVNNVTATVEGFHICNGSTSANGGGIYVAGNSDVEIQDNKIYSNTISSTSQNIGGGGVYVHDGTGVVVQGNDIFNNTVNDTAYFAGGGGLYIRSGDARVEENDIHDNVAPAYGGGGIYIRWGSSTVRGNAIYSNTQQGGNNGGGGIYVYNASPTIEGNDIYANSAAGSWNPAGGGGIYIEGGSPKIRNNLIRSNTTDSNDEGGGILVYMFYGGTPVIDSNTIYGNWANSGGGIYDRVGSSTVRNNIISNTNGGGIVGVTCSYCDIWGNVGGNTGGDGNSITANPQFVNPGVDLHLQEDSPCIDAGDPVTTLDEDFEGDPRPLCEGYDMGADESTYCLGVAFAPDREGEGVPGESTVYTHYLTNTGSVSDTFALAHSLTVGGVDDGWSVDYTPIYTLTAGEGVQVPVTVGVAANTMSGTQAVVIITATSQLNPRILDTVINTTTARCPDVVIDEDTTWDEDAVVVNSLVVTNSATLTLVGTTVITATNVTVAEGAAISADGQGYGSSAGTGQGTDGTGAWNQAGGGGHGGWGGGGTGEHAGGEPYDDVYQPLMLGSGGGETAGVAGGAGGGAIRLVVSGALAVSGTVSANGHDGAGGNFDAGGGGSGGSVWIEAGTFTGAGTVSANGGNGGGTRYNNAYGRGGGGAGGRIALYAGANTFGGALQARGGSGNQRGGAGTAYLKGATGLGALLVDNGGNQGAGTGLVPGQYEFDDIRLTGKGNLTIIGAASVLTLTNEALVDGDGTARLTGEGVIVAPADFAISGATLVVQGVLAGPEVITTAGSGGLELHAHTDWHSGVYTFTDVTVGPGTVLRLISYDDGDGDYDDDYGLELRVEGLTVAGGGLISADGQGYGSSAGTGQGTDGTGAWNQAGGGGHGGWGGSGTGEHAGGEPYDDVYQPLMLGSGGGETAGVAGGAGGGAIRLVVSGALAVSGTVSANGHDGAGGNFDAGGGGSGGSVWIEAGTFTGAGTVSANGGDGGGTRYNNAYGRGGGGAGGRIALYAETDGFSGTVQALGGAGHQAGENGTVYLDEVDPLSSTLVAVPDSGIVADGVATSTVTVTLLTASGYPVPGKEVSLEVTLGTDNLINGTPITDYTPVLIGISDVSGTVTATLASTRAEVKTLEAWAEEVRLVNPLTITFVAGPPDAGTSWVWASPAEVAADGVTTATVHVRVYDANQNPVPGATVVLSDTGTGTVLTQPAEPTGADGRTWGTIASSAVEVVTVTATADSVPIADTAQVTFVGADLAVSKSGPATALAGTPVTYTLAVENEGQMTADGVVLTDTLPEGIEFITHTASFSFTQDGRTLTWQVGELAEDAQASLDLVATVAPTVAHRAELTNQATAAATVYEADTSDNTATATTTVYQPEPELEITPSYSERTLARGATATVTLTVENVGTTVAGGVTASSPPHLAWVSVQPESLPDLWPGESATFTATLAPPGDLPVGTYRDLVTVQTDGAAQRSAALAVQVVGLTRTLAISASDGSGPVVGANVHLVRQEESLLVTEGVTKTVHQEAQAQTGGSGVATLEGLEVGTYDYTIVATGHGAASGVVTVTAGSGAQQLAVTLQGLPLLEPEPLYPEIHVRPGETGYVEAVVRNAGLGAAENVGVTPPEGVDWIHVGVIGSTGELTAGQSLSVTLLATPPVTLTTPSVYQEYVEVTADNAPATRFALTVRVGQVETGTLQLQVADEAGAPLEGARVTLVSKQSTLLYSEGITQTYYESFVEESNAGGVVSFAGIPAGRYDYHVDAEGYEPLDVDPVVEPGGVCVEYVTLESLPFEVEWSVEETEITDVYSVTVHLTFEADRLEVLPLDVMAPCGGGTVAGTIQVRNPSSLAAENVQVTVDVEGVGFTITSGQGQSIPAGEVGQFDFTAQVGEGAYAEGWIRGTATGWVDSRAPVDVSTACTDDEVWHWGWGESGGVAVGTYTGASPSFGKLEEPSWDEGPTTMQLQLSQHALLERQAFLAELTLSNVISEVTGVQVYITARDPGGESQPEHFTITPTVPTALPDLTPGSGTVHQQWTIVPAYLGITEPATYTLRATLVYTADGVTYISESLPDVILVQPQPEVHVEYFVSEFVRADEPVLLGVRAENRGFGTARNLRIESALPQIVSQQGQPVSFEMLGTFEEGALQPGDMLLNFGDVPPGETVVGGWMMTFQYQGRFTELGVRCEHVDYRGMALSNLLYCDGGENIFSNDLQYLNGNECPDVSTCDKQGCVGGPINTRSGNYGYQALDLSLPTAGDPLRMERSYNSSNVLSDTDSLSAGWTHSYAMRLEFPDLSGGTFFTATTGDVQLDRSTIYYRPYVLVRLPGGSRVRFADNGDGTYTTYPGAQTALTMQEAGGTVTYTLTAADQTTRVFDGEGRLLLIRDRHGNETVLSYSGGRLARVTGPTGLRYLDLSYDAQGRLIEVRDSAGRAIGYGYDAVGDLTVVTDTAGLVWTYVYTGTHLLYEVYDPAENLVERTDYDATGRTVYQEDGAGILLGLDYDEHEMTVARAGRERTHRYDFFGALVGQVDAAGHTQSSAYNWDFRPEETTDALSHTTEMEWNSCCGQLAAITDTLGYATRMEYDANNNLTAHTDAVGHATHYEYDENNNLVATTDALSRTTRNGYDEFGHVISTTDQLGNTTLYSYDQLGQRIRMQDAGGRITTYGYDAIGRLITTTVGVGEYGSVGGERVTVNVYDDGDNLIRVTRNYLSGYPQNWQDTYNLITEYGYDEVGRRVVTTDTLGAVTRSEYDAAGRLVRSIQNYLPGQSQNYQDTYNLLTEYGYDAMGNQTLVTDTLAHVTFTEYDDLDRVERTWRNYLPGYPQNYQDTYNLVTEYGYDAVGSQVLVTDTLGSVTYTEYDELNRVARTWRNYLPGHPQNWQNTYNLVTEYEYDAVGNQIRVTDHVSRITFYEYDALNRPVTVTTNYIDGVFDPAQPDEDLVRVTTYDGAGRVSKTQDAGGRITVYEYDALGRQVAVVQNYQGGVYDPAQPDRDLRSETIYNTLGQVEARVQVAGEAITTTYEYDALGRLVTTTNALSGTTVTHYDALGRRIRTQDAGGRITTYEYDAAGRPVTTTNALSGTVVTTYDALGRRAATTDPLGHTSVYTYNAAGRLVEQRIGGIQRIQYGYDALGRRTVVTDADGVAVYSVYDSLGRLVETRNALGNATQYGYDALGNRVVMTDANGIATRYEYDDVGRLIAVNENWQAGQSASEQVNVRTEYGYDQLGNLRVITDGLGHTTVYTYDLAGRRVTEADPLGHVTEYVYDGHGRRVGEVYPDEGGPITVTTAHNALGWPTQVDYPAIGDVPGFTVEYVYDALGHRDVVTDSTGSTTYDYDALYQPLAIDAPTGDAHYEYDAAGQRTHLVYPTGEVVTYTHDAAGRLQTVTDWDGGTTIYTYTAAGRLSEMSLPNSVETAYEYDEAGRLVQIEHRDGDGALLARYAYTLDGMGNRVRVEETIVQPDEEPHGPGDVTVLVRDTDGNPEPGLHVYGFDGATYTGYNGTTNVSGTVTLAQLPEGGYRFRADKNGTHFWSGEANHCGVPACTAATITTTLPLTVTVRDTNGDPEEGLHVYAFDGPTYTGYNKTTDASGAAVFTLPQGDYRFRADKNGTHFWSGEANHCTIPGCTSTTVTTTIPLTVTVEDTNGAPEAGLPVYGFDGSAYTGYNETTDASGQAVFTLPQGDYRFRSDKNGTQFWSGEANHCTVPGCTSTTVTTTIPVVVSVRDSGGGPEAGLNVYGFDDATYTGYNGTTGVSGLVTFTLPLGDYRFRADKDGTHFWSGETNHCTVPGCTSAIITTTTPGVTVVVEDTNGDPEPGLPVYAFDGTGYTGYNGTTNGSGQATFTLPEGNYRFRSDKNGTQFWSGETNHCTVPGCASTTVTTTIPLTVTVKDTNGDPEPGLPVYAFDGASYSGYNKTTDASGEATFTLPQGDYRFRSDKNGMQFWSSEANHCTVPGCAGATITTTIPLTVTVEDTNGDPEDGLPVYAFDGTSYTGYNETTDGNGQATFTLPQGDYRFRADKDGTHFWSSETNHCTVPGCASAAITTTTPGVTVVVEDTNGDPEPGLPVYAFDDTTYSGYHGTTDVSGTVTLTLPAGDYRFRADKNGTHFWSGETNHCTVPGCAGAAITTTIPVVVTVEDGDGDPEPNLPVYAFDDTTYSGYHGTTDVSGTVTLTLPAGDYRFRADKNGEQYWSGTSNHCTVPGCAAVTITVGSQALGMPAGGVASGYSLPDLSLLLLAPLAVAALGRRKRWQHWTWPLAGVLLVVAVVSSGTALAEGAEAQGSRGAEARAPALSENDLLLAPVPVVQPQPAPRAQSAGTITTTRVISYTYDPLGRLVEADYSTGESFAYQYDAVGNRTAFTQTTALAETTVTTYTYDAANRLLVSLSPGHLVTYAWDDRGNLTHDGTFTYTYNATGRMVRAESVTSTLVYTYNVAGLRVAQSVDDDVTTFAWDWAAGVPEMLSEGTSVYLVGHDTLGTWDGIDWAYYLPDALGSVRQATDADGMVLDAREWTPFGAQAGLGFTGEYWDADMGLQYLRARWYAPGVGGFLARDPFLGFAGLSQTQHPYTYVDNNPIGFTDPSGLVSCDPWPSSIRWMCEGAEAGDLGTIVLLYRAIAFYANLRGGDYHLAGLMLRHYLDGNGNDLDISWAWGAKLGKDPGISNATDELFAAFILNDVKPASSGATSVAVGPSFYRGLDFYDWEHRPLPQSAGFVGATGHFAINGEFEADVRLRCETGKYLVKFIAEYSVDDTERYEWFWDVSKGTGTVTQFGNIFGTGEIEVPHKWAVALRDATPPRAYEYKWTATWRDKGRLLVESDWSSWRQLKWWEPPY